MLHSLKLTLGGGVNFFVKSEVQKSKLGGSSNFGTGGGVGKKKANFTRFSERTQPYFDVHLGLHLVAVLLLVYAYSVGFRN